MKIKEIRERNKTEFKLYLWYAPFNNNGTPCRRVVLQKDGFPHIVSEDYEVFRDGEWVLPSP